MTNKTNEERIALLVKQGVSREHAEDFVKNSKRLPVSA